MNGERRSARPGALHRLAADPGARQQLLALDGELGTERLSKAAAQARFEQKHHFAKVTEKVVAYVERAELKDIPSDAVRLARWLARARDVLSVDGSSDT